MCPVAYQIRLKSLVKAASMPGWRINCPRWIPMTAIFHVARGHAHRLAVRVFSPLSAFVPGYLSLGASNPMTLVPAAPPPGPSSRLPLTGSSTIAMDTFSGVPDPVPSNFGTWRAASAARTLPHWPFAAAFANHHGSHTPFPNHSLNSHQIPQADPGLAVFVVCWPMTPHGSEYQSLTSAHPAPCIVVHNEHVGMYGQCFVDNFLAVKVTVPRQGHIPHTEFFTTIKTHLDSHHISFPPPFYSSQGSAVQGCLYAFSSPKNQELSKLNNKFRNPLTGEDSNLPWIWIGPVARFLSPGAPLSGNHPCFGLRILDELPRPLPARDDLLEIECYPEDCPSQNLAPIYIGHSVDPKRGVLEVASPAHRVRARQDSAGHAPSPIEVNDPPSTSSRPEITSLEPHIDCVGRPTSIVAIHGKTVEAVAACIVDLMVHFQKHDSSEDAFVMEDSALHTQMIISENTADIVLESFFNPVRCILIGVNNANSTRGRARAVTNGAGPERAALRHTCTVLTAQHHNWQQVPGLTMFQPVLTPRVMDPDRLKTFRVHGMFLALHCFILMQGPLPISIWLLLSLIHGKDALLIPKNLLLYLDPGAYDILPPWYNFHRQTLVPPPSEATHPLRLFILEYMPDMQLNLIPDIRSPEVHNEWLISAFATILLGNPYPWDNPEYITLQDGFNTALAGRPFKNNQFRFQGLNARDSALAGPLGFYTCFYSINVHLDKGLREILLEPVKVNDRSASKFDLWLHEQLVKPNHNTR
ncbi:hypothetical protein K438DRAFT_2120182 [Mycena galopus ATCC 62051]|nr:hypothetical protein K438DRAFT_2120182 [Mycena galopus ATCC 62051]